MELASLILGATAIVIPAYQGIDKLCNTISDARKHTSQLEDFWLQVFTVKATLRNECVLLFGSDFDAQDIAAMLADKDHPNWNDRDFQQKFSDHLGRLSSRMVWRQHLHPALHRSRSSIQL